MVSGRRPAVGKLNAGAYPDTDAYSHSDPNSHSDTDPNAHANAGSGLVGNLAFQSIARDREEVIAVI